MRHLQFALHLTELRLQPFAHRLAAASCTFRCSSSLPDVREAEKVENGVRTLRELARSYRAITQDLTREMNRLGRSKNRDREEKKN